MGGAAAANTATEADRAQARQILQKMMDNYGKISAPTLSNVAPETLGDTALAGVQEDPTLRNAQYGELSGLQQIQDDGGMTLADRASQNTAMNQVARKDQAGRAAIADDFASRGQLGSGAQLAMSLKNQQQSAQSAADVGMNTAAAAQKRYYQSVLDKGQAAGQISDRQYSRDATAAKARDAIASHNAAAKTDAARYSNSIANQNFSNQMGLTSAQSGAGYKQADYLNADADRKAKQITGTASGLSKIAGNLNFGDDEELT